MYMDTNLLNVRTLYPSGHGVGAACVVVASIPWVGRCLNHGLFQPTESYVGAVVAGSMSCRKINKK